VRSTSCGRARRSAPTPRLGTPPLLTTDTTPQVTGQLSAAPCGGRPHKSCPQAVPRPNGHATRSLRDLVPEFPRDLRRPHPPQRVIRCTADTGFGAHPASPSISLAVGGLPSTCFGETRHPHSTEKFRGKTAAKSPADSSDGVVSHRVRPRVVVEYLAPRWRSPTGPFGWGRPGVLSRALHRWQFRPRLSKQATRPYIYACPALGKCALLQRSDRCGGSCLEDLV